MAVSDWTQAGEAAARALTTPEGASASPHCSRNCATLEGTPCPSQPNILLLVTRQDSGRTTHVSTPPESCSLTPGLSLLGFTKQAWESGGGAGQWRVLVAELELLLPFQVCDKELLQRCGWGSPRL